MEAPGSPENFPQRRRSPERSEAPAKPRWPAGEQPLWGRRSPGRRARRRGQPCPPRWEAERKPGEPRAAPPRLGCCRSTGSRWVLTSTGHAVGSPRPPPALTRSAGAALSLPGRRWALGRGPNRTPEGSPGSDATYEGLGLKTGRDRDIASRLRAAERVGLGPEGMQIYS
ncbi:PREDICTED: ataxin-2-like protein isoform X2 [Chinchilla lanigera]|uniref:ataxin-2-like protein isoform X2 n=1 Tax=Chinchilla lanigera TaxID=34839 RepID=UPI0006964766|nr:PREDICTED: ataxin-2-like protein isoform X2 [Chinchilla lanigera]